MTNCTDYSHPCSPRKKDMAFALYSAAMSLKEELELVSISNPESPSSTWTKEELRTLYNEANLMDSLLRDAFGESYLESGIEDLVVSLQRDLEMLLRKKKLCDNVKSMDSLLIDSLSESYYGSQVSRVVASMESHVSFHKEEFQKLHNNLTLMDSLLTESLGESYLQSKIREVLFSMKTNLERAMEPFFRKEYPELYNTICSLCWLLTDFSEENYNNEMMNDFKNRNSLIGDEVLNQVLKPEVMKFVGDISSNAVTIVQEGRGRVNQSFDLTLLLVIKEEISCICNELMKIHKDNKMIENTFGQYLDNQLMSTTGPSQRYPNKYGNAVGRQNDLAKMSCCLTRNSTNLEVFPIIGPTGIGKTTFAKELYNNPNVIHHFDVLAWGTISQECQPRELLLDLLSCFINLSDDIYEMDNVQLYEQLYRSLKGKKYLIMLDDVWDTKVWDNLSGAFRNDWNGSKVVLTSQLLRVAVHASPNIRPHYLGSLNPEESWELLCSKIFPNESCPLELLPIGKQIAYNCHGVPLGIVVIGGLLSKMNKTLKVWEEVAHHMGFLDIEHPQYLQNMLDLSYKHLPNVLKACFLYMGIFPTGYEISSKKLIFLWIAEGLIRPNVSKTLEEIAEDYLKDLVTRNLVMIKRKRSRGGFKICQMHDLIREFCLRESRKENFLRVIHDHSQMSIGSVHDVEKYCKEFLQRDLQLFCCKIFKAIARRRTATGERQAQSIYYRKSQR